MNVIGTSLYLILALAVGLLTGCTLDIKFENLPSTTVSNPVSTNVEYSSKTYRDYYSAYGHYNHTASNLGNGKILVIGGQESALNIYPTANVEIFDTTTKRWSAGPAYPTNVAYHTATEFSDGTVLIVGGGDYTASTTTSFNAVYLYDPASNTFTQKASMNVARFKHTATLLADGKVLVTGGTTNGGNPISSVEIYDPVANTWTVKASLNSAVAEHTATLLADGRVFVAGGNAGAGLFTPQTATQVYNPTTNAWSNGPSLTQARVYHTSTLMDDGKVLIAGGYVSNTGLNTAEVYNPTNSTSTAVANLPQGRAWHRANLVNGWVVLTAGRTNTVMAYDTTIGYNPYTNAWVSFGSLTNARNLHTTTLVGDTLYAIAGQDAVGGGLGVAESLDLTNLIDASTYAGAALGLPSWTPTADLAVGRIMHKMVVLKNGKVLASGGARFNIALSSTAIYDPATNLWTPGPNMSSPRMYHSMTVMKSGKVLIAGGIDSTVIPTSADIYDPDTNTMSTTTWAAPRALHVSALLANGKVMLSGGMDINSTTPATTDLYDETTNTWSTGTARPSGGYYETLTAMADNKFFIYGMLGGYIYNATTDSWTATAAPTTARFYHTTSLLPGNKILMAGGQDLSSNILSSTEIYDPANDTWTAGAPLPTVLAAHTAVTMNSGKVAVIGGQTTGAVIVKNVRFYDVTTDTWTEGTAMNDARNFHESVIMPNGKVLVYAGQSQSFGFLPFWEQILDP